MSVLIHSILHSAPCKDTSQTPAVSPESPVMLAHQTDQLILCMLIKRQSLDIDSDPE